MTSLFHSDLSKEFSLILNDADDYNVVIQVGENNNTEEFRAHFNDMNMFSKPNITPIVFDIVLKYIYST
ncbi:BTB/POZ protein [Rhizophagus clarus]|uniref:BTB/POZ protein n=1 Tax=Rhizophagus clarus TaxID=94130 RepID=A0A8H3M9Y2_9GLOM|nr:BTB/POZ protein [Rhizophagus clarus]